MIFQYYKWFFIFLKRFPKFCQMHNLFIKKTLLKLKVLPKFIVKQTCSNKLGPPKIKKKKMLKKRLKWSKKHKMWSTGRLIASTSWTTWPWPVWPQNSLKLSEKVPNGSYHVETLREPRVLLKSSDGSENPL